MLPIKYFLPIAMASGGGVGSICWASNATIPSVPSFNSEKRIIQPSRVCNLNNTSNGFQYADLTRKPVERLEEMGIWYNI